MKFSIKVREFLSRNANDSLSIVDLNTVTLEVIRFLQSRECPLTGAIYSPVKQYFVEIIPEDEGEIGTMEKAVDCALTKMSLEVTSSGNFTLWVKGRRYSTFEFKPTQYRDIYKEVLYEVDSDMSFNREEWGLTQEQRKC